MKNLILNSLLVLPLLFGAAQKAQAHLPDVLVIPAYVGGIVLVKGPGYIFTNLRLITQGFMMQPMQGLLSNGNPQAGVYNFDAEILYTFSTAKNLQEAKAKCAVNESVISTPEEVRTLYKLRGFNRIAPFFVSPKSKGHVMGFHDGAQDYFKLKVRNGATECYNRESELESPVVCSAQVTWAQAIEMNNNPELQSL